MGSLNSNLSTHFDDKLFGSLTSFVEWNITRNESGIKVDRSSRIIECPRVITVRHSYLQMLTFFLHTKRRNTVLLLKETILFQDRKSSLSCHLYLLWYFVLCRFLGKTSPCIYWKELHFLGNPEDMHACEGAWSFKNKELTCEYPTHLNWWREVPKSTHVESGHLCRNEQVFIVRRFLCYSVIEC